MKKIFLIFALMFSLVGCTEATTTMTYPQMSYLSFSAYWITDVDEQLTQEEDTYYLYFYGSHCSACFQIRDEALYTIEFLTNDVVYFVEADTLAEIHEDIAVGGTPSIVKVVNGEAVDIQTNGTNVLTTLHGLS